MQFKSSQFRIKQSSIAVETVAINRWGFINIQLFRKEFHAIIEDPFD